MRIDALVEGAIDEIVARRLVTFCGHEFGTCFGKRGCDYIRRKVNGFSKRGLALLVLTDFMDFRYACPAELVADWVFPQQKHLILRVVMREMESWLMADRAGLAKFLGVPVALIPRDPEIELDPKQTLTNIARRSRSRSLRDAIVPGLGRSASVGPGYVAELSKFAQQAWNPDAARRVSSSLDRCLLRLAGAADASNNVK